MTLNKKNRVALQTIFERPTRADIKWSRIENLFRALGGIVQQRSGSRVFLSVNGLLAVSHKPHPEPETGKADVEDVRRLLRNAGVTP